MTWNFRRIIGLIAVLAGISMVFTLFFVEVPGSNTEAVWGFVGLIIGWGGTVIGYEFGSSSGGRALALGDAAKEEREG
jgi:putative Mn2+ efflux pump MntP